MRLLSAKTLLIGVLLTAELAWAGDQTVTLKTVDGTETVTYSPDQVKREDVVRWVQLSPHVSDSNSFLVPEALELCVDGAKEYRPCGSRDFRDANFFANAEVNLNRIRQRIKEMESPEYPNELRPVTDYYVRLQKVSQEAD